MGPRRHRGGAAGSRSDPGRSPRPAPGGECGGRRCRARRAGGGRHRDRGPGCTAAWLCDRGVAGSPRVVGAGGRSRRAARWGTQPGRSRGARTGARRPATAPRAGGADPGDGVHGRQGRRWSRDGAGRGGSASRRIGDRDERRRPARDAGRGPRRALASRRRPGQRDRGPRSDRRGRCRHGNTWDDGRRRLALSCGCDPRPSRRRPRSARPRSWSPRSMTAPRRKISADPAPIRIGPVRFTWGRRTHVMGILNVTPDSFSGDGLLEGTDPVERAVATAVQMVAEGADLLDIGGESTRPGHVSVDATEELRRVIPVITAMAVALPDTPISVDTAKPVVAEAAIAAGAHLLNDVWGTGPDVGEMAAVAAGAGVPLIVMHNRAEARYERNVVTEVVSDLGAALDRAIAAGVPEDDLIVDPGIGFGKTADHNVSVLCHLGALSTLGRPVLLGTSRKSTLGRILDLPVEERLEATLATTALGIAAGVDLVRVHDVAPNVRVAQVSDAIVRGHWRDHADTTGSTR